MKNKIIYTLWGLVAIVTMLASCQNEGQMTYNRYYSVGSTLYANRCQNCHGVNAEGLNNLIPPFTDSVYLRKNLSTLPCIIKYGTKQTITVNGKKFNSAMPAQTSMSAIEIAEVLTYITNSYGNKMGLIDVQTVEKDLAGCR